MDPWRMPRQRKRREEVYLNFVPLLRDPRYFLMVLHIFPSLPIHSHLILVLSFGASTSHALSTDAVLAIRDKISALLRDLLLHWAQYQTQCSAYKGESSFRLQARDVSIRGLFSVWNMESTRKHRNMLLGAIIGNETGDQYDTNPNCLSKGVGGFW